MRKLILIITTGGTIAMRKEKNKGIVPNNDLSGFLKSFPQLSEVADIDVYEFSNIPSPYMTPQKMLDLTKLIDVKIVDYDGVVITHGTDSLEETAYLVDLVSISRKPIVLTAAMRSGSELGLDGPRNIIYAVRVACELESRNKGALVVMNDDIHSARDVVKTDTGKVSSFESLQYGKLGNVDPDKVVFHRISLKNETCWTDELETNIDLIKVTTGMDDRFIRASIDKGARGIVIEAFGRGNVPKSILPAIVDAIAENIIVLIVSRAYTGRVLPEYGYDGGGKNLIEIGAILGGDLKGHKARLKLMVLIGRYKEIEIVKKIIQSDN
ncbi:MAG: asparaginase [Candidatus Cloacimonadota bacterium]|nr:asparaginase [Candidatus Cloacimonadota bacterium]